MSSCVLYWRSVGLHETTSYRGICVFTFSLFLHFRSPSQILPMEYFCFIAPCTVFTDYFFCLSNNLSLFFTSLKFPWHVVNLIVSMVECGRTKRRIAKQIRIMEHCRQTYVSDILSIFHTYHHHHQINYRTVLMTPTNWTRSKMVKFVNVF